jgi:hypothetical protein
METDQSWDQNTETRDEIWDKTCESGANTKSPAKMELQLAILWHTSKGLPEAFRLKLESKSELELRELLNLTNDRNEREHPRKQAPCPDTFES